MTGATLTDQRRFSLEVAERKRSMGTEDAEWIEGEMVSHSTAIGSILHRSALKPYQFVDVVLF